MKKLIVILLLALSATALGQQDPLFSQYMFNKLLVNPAYAGSREILSIDILDRYQWVGIEGAPRTFTFSANTALRNRKVGLGFYVYRDALGPIINQGLQADYAFRIFLDKGVLALGLQAGFNFFDFTWLEEYTQDPDYMFLEADTKPFSPDANFGIYYNSNRFYVGLSSKHLLQNEYGMVRVEDKNTYMRLAMHFYVMMGYAFTLTDELVLKPSVLAKYVVGAPTQMDINLSLVVRDRFWIGAGYRTEKAVILLTEFRFTHFLRVGYAFDMYLNELQNVNYGTHEIRIGLDFELFQSRMLTPRYFF